MKFDVLFFKKRLASLSEEALDAILEAREEAEFDKAWIKAHEAYGKLKRRWPRAAKTFQQISAAARGHELADYIADDMDLIACYEHSHSDDSFMKLLIACYETGQVPGEHRFNDRPA